MKQPGSVAHSRTLGVWRPVRHVPVETGQEERHSGIWITQGGAMQGDNGTGGRSAPWGSVTQFGNSALWDAIGRSTSLSRPPENDDSRLNIVNSQEETQLPHETSWHLFMEK